VSPTYIQPSAPAPQCPLLRLSAGVESETSVSNSEPDTNQSPTGPLSTLYVMVHMPACRSLLEAVPVDVPKVAEQARNAKAMLEDARRVVLDVLSRDITKMYSAYCSGPASAYAELARCWVPLQRVSLKCCPCFGCTM
jgi:hypothetical protein